MQKQLAEAARKLRKFTPAFIHPRRTVRMFLKRRTVR